MGGDIGKYDRLGEYKNILKDAKSTSLFGP